MLIGCRAVFVLKPCDVILIFPHLRTRYGWHIGIGFVIRSSSMRCNKLSLRWELTRAQQTSRTHDPKTQWSRSSSSDTGADVRLRLRSQVNPRPLPQAELAQLETQRLSLMSEWHDFDWQRVWTIRETNSSLLACHWVCLSLATQCESIMLLCIICTQPFGQNIFLVKGHVPARQVDTQHDLQIHAVPQTSSLSYQLYVRKWM